MRFTTLISSALLLALASGCKSKQAAQTTSADPAPAAQPAQEQAPAATTQEEDQGAQTKLGPDSVFFSLERTPCFGTCPAFKITIGRNGNATYFGRRFAPREGLYVGKVDTTMMQALLDKATAVGFFTMQDKYDRPVTDLPSTIIRVHTEAQDKQVVGRVGPPQGFKDLAKEAESILSPVSWTKVGE